MAKRQTAGFWERHLEGWRKSGLTRVAYCANHGLRRKSLGGWRSKARKTAQGGYSLLTRITISLAAPETDGVVPLNGRTCAGCALVRAQ